MWPILGEHIVLLLARSKLSVTSMLLHAIPPPDIFLTMAYVTNNINILRVPSAVIMTLFLTVCTGSTAPNICFEKINRSTTAIHVVMILVIGVDGDVTCKFRLLRRWTKHAVI
jgi:hypothetical protein